MAYNDFVKLKGVSSSYNPIAVKEYLLHNNLILTIAYFNDDKIAQHVYVCDDINAKLLYSVSIFRNEGLDKNLIGRANKGLHWFDILNFKSQKKQTLDWGGVTSFVSPNGIDKFKMGFGTEQLTTYNLTVGLSLLGKLFVFVKNLLRIY